MTPQSLWRNESFSSLWAAQSAAFLGFQTAFFAIPLVGTLLLDASPSQLGSLGAAFFAASLLYGLFAGLWADRLDRRQMLLQGDALTLLCGLSVPLAAGLGKLSMEFLYVLSFFLGVGVVHFDAAAAALLPTLLSQPDLVPANGRLQLSMGIARVAGPTLGGVLIQHASPLLAVGSGAVGWVMCGLLLLRLRPLALKVSPPARIDAAAEIAAGMQFVLSTPSVRSTAAYTALATGFAATTMAMLPLYAIELGLTPASLGLAVGATGLGGIVGAVLIGTKSLKVDRRRLGVGSAAVIAAAQWLLPAASAVPHLAVATLAASQFFIGAALAIYTSIALSLQQESTPDALRGRMFASVRFARYASAALGAMAGGLIGQALGLAPLTALAAVGATRSVWWLVPRAIWVSSSNAGGETEPASQGEQTPPAG